MSLKEIKLSSEIDYQNRKQFNTETWSISELYWSFLKNYNSKNIIKISIIATTICRNKWFEETTGFIDYYFQFNFDKYFKISKNFRKQMQLEAIQEGMMQIAQREGWDTDPLLDAYNGCLAENLKYQFGVGKLKSSPDRKFKIGFWCNWDIDIFEVYWVLYDKNDKEITREKFLEKPPYDGEFIYYVRWKWLDNSTVLLEDKYKYGKGETWKIKVCSDSGIIIY